MAALAHEVIATEPESGPIIAFDGVCNLCNGTVDFVISRDRRKKFRFLSLQSEAGRRILKRAGMPSDELATVLLVERDRVSTKSTAILRILRSLGGVWKLAGILLIIPRPLRDAVYDWIARHRYGWFGQRNTCRVPSAEERDRFLE